jgi:hypothetical protein
MTPTTYAPDLATSWSRMRTDSPTLAEQLVTDDFRLWADTAPTSDTIVGPRELARLVTDEQERTKARITASIVAGDAQRVAFTWDATLPDGTVLTGIDVARVATDGRFAASWSIIGERRDTINTVPATGATPEATMQRVCAQWTEMWNGDGGLAHDLITDDFRIWFGTNQSADDSVLGPQAMENYVNNFHSQLGTVRFREEGDFVLDTARARAAVIWTVTLPPLARPEGVPGTGAFDLGGIDLFQFTGSRIARVWSITGTRPHTLPN